MRRYLATIGRNVTINTSDTGIDPKTIRGYLPGGTMSAVWENLVDLVVTTRNEDQLGRWSAITIGRDNKLIELITVYRLNDSTDNGIITTHTQYNQVLEKNHTTRHYRQEFLKDLSKYMQ